MVIFHSYVSLPEGNRLPTATKPIQALFWERLAMGDQLKPIEGLIFQDFFRFFSIFSWFASKAVLIPYGSLRQAPERSARKTRWLAKCALTLSLVVFGAESLLESDFGLNFRRSEVCML